MAEGLSDRAGGGGLLPCPLCQSSNITLGTCYLEGSSEKTPAALCVECGCRASLKAWNTRGPTRDGAEGAGEVEITTEMAVAGRKALAIVADRMEEAKLLAVSSIDFWQRVGHEPANEIYKAMVAVAPQNPAPDAIRTGLQDALEEIVLVIAFLERDGGTDRLPATIKSLTARLVKADRAIRDILSAPVPPADGAHYDDGRNALADRLETSQHCWCLEAGNREQIIKALRTPSGIGAAEPVVCRRVRSDAIVTYWETAVPDSVPLYAVPSVKGDREAIARLADEICKDPRIFTRDWNHSLEGLKAVIIERLGPVQPGASERS